MKFTFLFLNLAKIQIFIPKKRLTRSKRDTAFATKNTVFFGLIPQQVNPPAPIGTFKNKKIEFWSNLGIKM